MSGVYLQTWCPGTVCDPCACHWNAYGVPLYHNPLDGTIDVAKSFCGVPYWGIGAVTDDFSAEPGTIVTGKITLAIRGVLGLYDGFVQTAPGEGDPLTPPTVVPADLVLPPPINVKYSGATVFVFDPAAGVISGLSASITASGVDLAGAAFYLYAWSATCTLSFSDCIMADPVLDSGMTLDGSNCLLPYLGPFSGTEAPPTYESTDVGNGPDIGRGIFTDPGTLFDRVATDVTPAPTLSDPTPALVLQVLHPGDAYPSYAPFFGEIYTGPAPERYVWARGGFQGIIPAFNLHCHVAP